MVQKLSMLITVLLLLVMSNVNAEKLFEVKDEFGNPVMVVSSEGLTILNANDTIMVISNTQIKAFIKEDTENKALSRSFSVSTSTTGSNGNVLDVTPEGMRVGNESGRLMDITRNQIRAYVGDDPMYALSRSFSVTTSTTAKEEINLLNVNPAGMSVSSETDKLMDITEENITAYIDEDNEKALSRSFSITTSTSAEKDGKGNIFNVANDGLRVGNEYGKLMDITRGNITAYIGEEPMYGLSRSFSVASSTSVKDGEINILDVNPNGLSVSNETEKLMDIQSDNITAYINEDETKALSRSFAVTTSATGKDSEGSVLKVAPDGLRIRNKNEKIMDITKKKITAYVNGKDKALSRSFAITTSASGKSNTEESIVEVAEDGLRVRNEKEQLVKELEILRAEIDLIKQQLSGLTIK